jgi:hypothetical protein
MKKHSLSSKGLSLSQAQSISNLCNQRATDIAAELNGINNVEKKLKIGEETYIETVGKPVPSNLTELLLEKAKLHATQAFLMENVKAKDTLISEARYRGMDTDILEPKKPKLETFNPLDEVNENFGWSELSSNEINEYIEAEAYAAHIGQFIHKHGALDSLRKELPTIKTLEWIEVEHGKKTPLMVTIHHTNEQLLDIHNELATKHRQYEQRVNYFKAKVKDLTTAENARIARHNADGYNKINAANEILNNQHQKEYQTYIAELTRLREVLELQRQTEISEISSLRINVDQRFQDVIDIYLNQLN